MWLASLDISYKHLALNSYSISVGNKAILYAADSDSLGVFKDLKLDIY